MELDFHCGSEFSFLSTLDRRCVLANQVDNGVISLFDQYLASEMPYPYDEPLAEQGRLRQGAGRSGVEAQVCLVEMRMMRIKPMVCSIV